MKNWKPSTKYDFETLLAKWKKGLPEVDDIAPEINATNFLGLRKLQSGAELFVQRTNENTDILKKDFKLLLTRGPTNPYREPHTAVDMHPNNYRERERVKALRKENNRIFRHIYYVKGDIERTSAKVLSPKCRRYRDYKRFVVPKEILSKYPHIPFPQGELLWKLLRPRIWIEMELVRVPKGQLGRITIELYTEAAPMVISEFVRCCVCKNLDRMKFLRLFPNLWLEGQIKLDYGRLMHGPLEYDLRALKHDAGGGILSFPVEFVNGFHYGVLSFTISSRPLTVINDKRVAFGRIINGLKIIELLQEYGTKNGKLKKELRVTACGVDM